jgi:hypothetical protein
MSKRKHRINAHAFAILNGDSKWNDLFGVPIVPLRSSTIWTCYTEPPFRYYEMDLNWVRGEAQELAIKALKSLMGNRKIELGKVCRQRETLPLETKHVRGVLDFEELRITTQGALKDAARVAEAFADSMAPMVEKLLKTARGIVKVRL